MSRLTLGEGRRLEGKISLNPNRGFTLIEVLVALALLGLISVMLGTAFRHSQTILVSVLGSRERMQELADAQGTLRKWIALAHPFAGDRTPGETIYALHGTSDELTFSAPMAAVDGQNDLYRIHLRVDENLDTLLADVRPDRPGMDLPPNTGAFTLLSGVTGMSVSYLDVAGGSVWRNDWQGRERLPNALKIALTFPAGDPRGESELVVNLRVSGQEFCEFDPVVRRCR